MTARLLPYGPTAWLVELDGDEDPARFAMAVRATADASVVDVVPAARTVLVTLKDPGSAGRAGAWLGALDVRSPGAVAGAARDEVVVIVDYDGPDLTTVADACGLTPADVVARHSSPNYRCAFCGFAPGFGYLTGLDPALHLPRRATPRTRVPAGSVAIAAGYTAVYPAPSPGGWHLIGTTDAALWDAGRDPPALIVPGTTVRFEAR